jgi:hypothetical protein
MPDPTCQEILTSCLNACDGDPECEAQCQLDYQECLGPPSCNYQFLQYGDFIFKGYTKTSLNKQNVYAEDGLTLKYIRCTLEAEFILTKELVSLVDGQITPTFPTGFPQPADSVDVAMDTIRMQLMRPQCKLIFWHHGAGVQVNVLGKTEPATLPDNVPYSYKYPNLINYRIFDGPFPEVLSWEPIGFNNAVRCRWRCTFNLTLWDSIEQGALIGQSDTQSFSRTNAGNRSISSIVTNYFNTLSFDPGLPNGVKFENYVFSIIEEQEFTVSEEGTVVVTLTGVIEFTSSGMAVLDRKGEPGAVPRLIQLMTHYFEPLHPIGFSRSQKYKFRKSKRELEYVIVDTEFKSDNPMMPNIIAADVSHEVSSDLLNDDVFGGSGFYSWNNTIEGTITVAPGKWVGWAWIAMMCILQQRLNLSQPISVDDANKVNVKDEVAANQNQNLVPETKEKPRHLLHKIRIKESIYTRKVDFTFGYMVLSSLNNLFKNTGLFTPVYIAWDANGNNITTYPESFGLVPEPLVDPATGAYVPTPKSYDYQWKYQREYLTKTQNVFGYRGPLLPGYDILFNPYDAVDDNRPNPTTIGIDTSKNPEKAIADAGDDVDVGTYNIKTLAQYRRNHHLQSFTDLAFSSASNDEKVVADAKKVAGTAVKDLQNPSTNFESYPGTQLNMASWLKTTDPKLTWIDYDMQFEVIRDENSVLVPSIESQNPSSRHNNYHRPDSTKSSYRHFTIIGEVGTQGGYPTNPDSPDSPYKYHNVQSFGAPVTYVRCVGSALRVGYPIPTPSLVGIQTRSANGGTVQDGISTPLVKAYRVGVSQWTHRLANKSVDLPVFEASWNITYALLGDPVCASIGFRTTQASEFS